jgi:hypothetical protein
MDHPCQQPTVQIIDPGGAVVANFVQLCEYGYFGGSAYPLDAQHPLRHILPGPHFTHTDLLPIVGRIALMDAPAGGYEIRCARGGYYSARIGRVMNVRDLAGAVGCAEDHVREYFASVVTLNEERPSDGDNG